MWKKCKFKDFEGVRKPTAEEKQKISRYYEHLYGKEKKKNTILGAIFVIIGFLCLLAFTSKTSGWYAVAMCVLFFAMGFVLLKKDKRAEKSLQIFRNGDFEVLDGKVCEIQTDTTGMLGVNMVRFVSKGGQTIKGIFRVRLNGLAIGTPLILIHTDDIIRAFTPFMLSEEGLKGTLF